MLHKVKNAPFPSSGSETNLVLLHPRGLEMLPVASCLQALGLVGAALAIGSQGPSRLLPTTPWGTRQ